MKYENNNLILLLVIVILLCTCCADKLRLTKTPYTGNQLRIDGYYYIHSEISKYYYSLILYSNGIALNGGGDPDLKNIEENFLDMKWVESVKNTQSWWGIYRIEGNSIQFEMWYSGNTWYLPAYISSGKILNDSTFVITSSERSSPLWSHGPRKENEMYHFKKFSPKPDSTNRFVPSRNDK